LKELIDNLKTIFDAAIAAGTVSAVRVFKGLQNEPAQVANTEYPYIMIDEGGERTEVDPEPDSTRAQNRFFDVIIEMGTYSLDLKQALDDILTLSDEVKTILELEANRQKDGFVWGVSITPFGWEDEGSFFRGRQIVMTYYELEDTIDRY